MKHIGEGIRAISTQVLRASDSEFRQAYARKRKQAEIVDVDVKIAALRKEIVLKEEAERAQEERAQRVGHGAAEAATDGVVGVAVDGAADGAVDGAADG
eukprot:2371283-Pleurochrysis_carterae.AAC.1